MRVQFKNGGYLFIRINLKVYGKKFNPRLANVAAGMVITVIIVIDHLNSFEGYPMF